ncbi:MAG TPA: alkaline phosphatase family protein [Terriglobales bacterium]|nr:alkaline phosphatase family protein [Terriglobales bacterium]
MKKLKTQALIGALALVPIITLPGYAQSKIQHVLLISVDGMHALDFVNCQKGVPDSGNQTYCPNISSLSSTGVHYVQALTSKPSDSFPGLTALVTGGTPRSTGAFYDVSYDRSLSPPARTTPYGIPGGRNLCPSVVGTQVGLDEEIDINYLKLDAGGGINPDYLPRDPKNGCAPVYPHNWIRVNTIFNVVKNAGGYTAWSDKHQSYELTKGPSGDGVDDFYAPEINSIPVPLPQVSGCKPLPDPGAATSSNAWTDSFQNIQCYDRLKVQAVLNWIDGKTHDGSASAPVPNVFGMNFQAVSVGQKLVEKSLGITGGYTDAFGTPSASLLGEIQFVDKSIGQFVSELKKQGLFDSTLIIISAKHGQSPIDPNRVLRIPADNPSDEPPSQVLSPSGIGSGFPVVQALEDDISLIWLADQTQTAADVALLEANENIIGSGEIFAGPSLDLMFNDPLSDPRTPDIILAPNVGVVYTGGTKKVAEHGGFTNDDRNVLLIVSNPKYKPSQFNDQVETRQIAPTIVKALGLDPNQLKAVQIEHTETLPGLPFTQK